MLKHRPDLARFAMIDPIFGSGLVTAALISDAPRARQHPPPPHLLHDRVHARTLLLLIFALRYLLKTVFTLDNKQRACVGAARSHLCACALHALASRASSIFTWKTNKHKQTKCSDLKGLFTPPSGAGTGNNELLNTSKGKFQLRGKLRHKR